MAGRRLRAACAGCSCCNSSAPIRRLSFHRKPRTSQARVVRTGCRITSNTCSICTANGVTTENNAVPLLLLALWPAELDPKDYATVVMELGLDEMPSKDEALVLVHDQSTMSRITNWLHEQAQNAVPRCRRCQ